MGEKGRGRFVYFGKVADDPSGAAALEQWMNDRDALLAGKTPRATGDGLTIRGLCNRFLSAKRAKLDASELVAVTFADHYATCALIVKAFGPGRLVADLDAADFESLRRSMTRRWGPVTVGNEVRRIKTVFRYAEQNPSG